MVCFSVVLIIVMNLIHFLASANFYHSQPCSISFSGRHVLEFCFIERQQFLDGEGEKAENNK